MRIFLTGGTGMVGRNILEHPEAKKHIIYAPPRSDVNLQNYKEVETAISDFNPDIVIHTAGLVGGIGANMNNQFDFLMENMLMGLNVVKAAKICGITKLINLGSTCMYPREAPQPLCEEYLGTGPLEPTNEGYAVAKNAVQRACQYASLNPHFQYKTYLPVNLFGRWDHYDSEKSHLLPAIIRKLHVAKTNNNWEIEIWGTGTPKREFMDAADLADFIFFSLNKFDEVPPVLNVSPGADLTISEIYMRTASIVVGEENYNKLYFKYNTNKPDGMMRKLSDISKQTNLGWKPKIKFEDTVKAAYAFFIEHEVNK